MAGHGGGAWKVAYADFVTAMMAFFLVMWIVAMSQTKPELKQAVARYFNDPLMTSSKPGSSSVPGSAQGEFDRTRSPGEGGRSLSWGFTEKSRKAPPQEAVKSPTPQKSNFAVLHDGDQSAAGTVLMFPELSADLTADAQRQLKLLVPTLRGKRNKIEIRGHATRRPLPPDSPFRDAWQLSYERCQATRKFLEREGIEADRMRLSQAGPYEPHTLKILVDQQAQNSRVEIYVLSEVVDDLIGTREERAARFKTPGQSRENAPGQ